MPLTSPFLLTPFLTGTASGQKGALRDAYIAIDGQDISALTHSITFERTREPVEVTGYTTVTREWAPGQDRSEFALELWADNSVQLPVGVRGQAVFVEAAAHKGAPQIENPLFAALCIVTRYAPLTGGTGDGAGVELDLLVAGPTIVTDVGIGDDPFPADLLFPADSLYP